MKRTSVRRSKKLVELPGIFAAFEEERERERALRRSLIEALEGECRRGHVRQRKSFQFDKELSALALAYLGGTPIKPRNEFGPDFHLQIGTTPEQIKVVLLEHLLEVISHNIAKLARRNNPDALQLLAKGAIALVRRLNQFARYKPQVEALRPLTRLMEVWPVLKSKHARFSQNEADYFGPLQLGEDLERNFSEDAKWSPDSLAAQFWEEIHDVRTRFRTMFDERSAVYLVLASHDKFLKRALELRPFKEPGAWKKWAQLAKERCLEKMEASEPFRNWIIAKIPRSKRARDWPSWLTTEFNRKFANMSRG